jgi:UDP-N-acetylglucosamine 2-epimerase (non-hydrolysing)
VRAEPAKVGLVFGTRPEAIKLCPLAHALRSDVDFAPKICVTGQHRGLLDQVLEVFGIAPDADLDLMRPNQNLAGLTALLMNGVSDWLVAEKPELVIVQGDTTTAMCGALSAFYLHIPVAHVEAGLRTGDKLSPFPEEINRVVLSRLADVHFAPTALSAQNLRAEGIRPASIRVTGNTVVDALKIAVQRVRAERPSLPAQLADDSPETQIVLVTAHRRESFDKGIASICRALIDASELMPAVRFVYPVHPNPRVREVVENELKGRRGIVLTPPLDYLQFVWLLDRCTAVLTDSGGIQEEAPALDKPVLVMRDTTERSEAIETGAAMLVGTDPTTVVRALHHLLSDSDRYRSMATARNPFGDGAACAKIIEALRSTLLAPSRFEEAQNAQV